MTLDTILGGYCRDDDVRDHRRRDRLGRQADAKPVTGRLASWRGDRPAVDDGGPVQSRSGSKPIQNVGGVQALITSQGLPPTQRKRCGRRLSK